MVKERFPYVMHIYINCTLFLLGRQTPEDPKQAGTKW